MANFNGVPTGDTPANSEAYNPESFSDTDDTARLPKLVEHANGSNSSSTPDTLPTTNQEQSSPIDNNSERKSHLGRNLVIGGVAVAVALSAWVFGKSGDNVKPTSDANSGSAIAESYRDDNDLNNPVYNNDEIRSDDSEDGLLASQVVNDYMTVNSGVDTMMASEYIEDWLYDNGYDTPSTGPSNDGSYILGGYGMITVHANDKNVGGAIINFRMISEDSFEIEISKTSLDDEATYNFTSNTLPTSEEANSIALERLNW